VKPSGLELISLYSMAFKGQAVDLATIPQHPKSEELICRIVRMIEGNLIFEGLDKPTRHALVLSMEECSVQPNQALITQGEPGDYFYVVYQGELECFVRTEGYPSPGRKVKDYHAGDTFGELALMYDCPRAATIVAKAPSRLYAIEKNTFQTLIQHKFMAERISPTEILTSVHGQSFSLFG
jgi:cAMP-dependent protein kinase regulator